jgi:hypothetical protein
MEFLKNPFNKPALRNEISSQVAVGWNQYGSTLTLSGTLTTPQKVVFINDISIELLYKAEKTKYLFSWLAFLPHGGEKPGYQGVELKMASKFMVTHQEAYAYNILFSDQDRYARLGPIFSMVKNGWNEFITRHFKLGKTLDIPSLYQSYLKEGMIRAAISKIQELSYWRTGAYHMKLKISTSSYKQETQKTFTLTDEDVQKLRDNILLIIADLCKQPGIVYQSAMPHWD